MLPMIPLPPLNLANPWDFSNMSFVSYRDANPLLHTNNIEACAFGDGGNKFYYQYRVGATFINNIYQLNLQSPYNFNNYTFSNQYVDFWTMGVTASFRTILWKPDGLRLFAFQGNRVNQIDLTAAWDISSAQASSLVVNTSTAFQQGECTESRIKNKGGIWIDPSNGTDFYYIYNDGGTTHYLAKMQMQNAWDFTSTTATDYLYHEGNINTVRGKSTGVINENKTGIKDNDNYPFMTLNPDLSQVIVAGIDETVNNTLNLAVLPLPTPGDTSSYDGTSNIKKELTTQLSPSNKWKAPTAVLPNATGTRFFFPNAQPQDVGDGTYSSIAEFATY